MCGTFKDALLHTLVVMSAYLNYSCPPITSKQSGPSSLTYSLNKTFDHVYMPECTELLSYQPNKVAEDCRLFTFVFFFWGGGAGYIFLIYMVPISIHCFPCNIFVNNMRQNLPFL